MKKRKILYVITKSSWGGAQRYVYDIATHLPKDEYEVVVVLGISNHTNTAGLKEKLEDAHIRTITVSSLERDIHIGKEFLVLRDLYKIFQHEKPDIVHLNSSKAGGIGALAARISKVQRIVFTSHGLVFEEPRTWLVRQTLRFLTWCTFLLCHKVILISKDNLKKAQTFFGVQHKLSHIYNGINKPQFLEREIAKTKLAKYISNGKPLSNETIIGTIAELTPNKGIAYLIRACNKLKTIHLNFVCFIIGEGELREILEKEIEALGLTQNIFLLGYISNAAQYLKGFDIFILPSLKEGYPYTLLEAGYASLPVIGTSIPGTSDIITDMQSGILVRQKSPEEIARAISYLIQHKQQQYQFGNALYENMKKKYTTQTMIKKTITLYKTS